jgi:hypothetical protein
MNTNNTILSNPIIKAVFLEKEKYSFYYTKDNTIYNVKRLILFGNELKILTYEIDIVESGFVIQKFMGSEQLDFKHESLFIEGQNMNSNWMPVDVQPILIVHFPYVAFEVDIELEYKLCNFFKDLIIDELESKQLGQLTDSYHGVTGVNYLFRVSNINKGFNLIHKIILTGNYEKNTIIGKAIFTSSEDWFYNIIYPNNFSGFLVTR